MGKVKESKSFENIFEDLENIVNKMDEGDVHLEKSLELFETGMNLVEEGKSKLTEAELKIKTLTKKSKS